MARFQLVTLTTDLGWAYAAQMKGVLSRLLPPAQIVDVDHELPAHGISEAAFVIRQVAPTLPSGTVHVVVVDPGVGGRRAPVAVRLRDGTSLVGPDNGVLSPLAEEVGIVETVKLD